MGGREKAVSESGEVGTWFRDLSQGEGLEGDA